MKLDPKIVHQLPRAPKFAGRSTELATLKKFWNGPSGVVSIIGAGGAGKTALLAEFLVGIQEAGDFDAIFVWSFYDDPNSDAFLKAAAEYFGGPSNFVPSGAGWFHVLKDALSDGRRNLIVMDGLERVQRAQTDSMGIYGELEDALLLGLLRRLVAGAGNSHVVITSRFPVTDLESFANDGYQILSVDELDDEAAYRLIKNRCPGIVDEQIPALLRGFGSHALTIDLLSGAISEFFGGDPSQAEAPDTRNVEPNMKQPLRLATVLRYYQSGLTERQVDLLSRLCIFRFGITTQFLGDIFLSNSNEQVAGKLFGANREELHSDLNRLVHLHLVHLQQDDELTVHPAIRDHFYRIFRDTQSVHDAVSSHLMTLTDRPGIGLPTQRDSLDLLEELIYHSIKAGRLYEAQSIYFNRLGGSDHLNVELGEYLRCKRILAAFEECPDPGGMYHCERAFGNFDEALKWRKQNTYIHLISGKLIEVAESGSATAKRAANFLMGRSLSVPEKCPDYPLPPARFYLIQRKFEDARRAATRDISSSISRDDIVRNQFCLAEAELMLGHPEKATEYLNLASNWAMSSGSFEHLVVMHLVSARYELTRRTNIGLSSCDEALTICKEANFKLLKVDTLNLLSQYYHELKNEEEAQKTALDALKQSSSEHMQYAWGQLEALRNLVNFGDDSKLEALRDLQRSLDDSEINLTELRIAESANRA